MIASTLFVLVCAVLFGMLVFLFAMFYGLARTGKR